MFRAKFWHSAELARKQAYINVAKSSILQAYVLASPDSAHFISLLYSMIPWRHHWNAKSKTRCLGDLCAQRIVSDDHAFWAHHFHHHHCTGALHHSAVHLGGPATGMWGTYETSSGLGWAFSTTSDWGAGWPRWMSEVVPKRSHAKLNQVYNTGFKGLFLM